MATRASTIAYLIEQGGAGHSGAGRLTAKPMFGEYGLYRDGKLVALVCDDQLYLKPTDAARRVLGTVVEAKPYPSAKPCFLIDADAWEDRDRLATLLAITADALPAPRAKRPRRGP